MKKINHGRMDFICASYYDDELHYSTLFTARWLSYWRDGLAGSDIILRHNYCACNAERYQTHKENGFIEHDHNCIIENPRVRYIILMKKRMQYHLNIEDNGCCCDY